MRTTTLTALALLCLATGPAVAYNPDADWTPFVKGQDLVIVTDWRTNAKETRTCTFISYKGQSCLSFSGAPITITSKDGQKFTCSSSIVKNTINGIFGCHLATPALLKVKSGNEVRCAEKVELDMSGNVDMCIQTSKKIVPTAPIPLGGGWGKQP